MVRTYLNGARAALAKSLLDDFGICSAVANENAHLYGGAPFAMPIGLLVDEDQAEQALRILDGDMEAAVDIEATPDIAPSPSESVIPNEVVKNNPWELLVIASLFLFPGICILQIKYPTVIPSTVWENWVVARLWSMHFFGWLAVAFAASLIVAYFYLRQASLAKADSDV